MFASGQYYFVVRPVDGAGNVGEQSDPVFFTVDKSLSDPRVIGEESSAELPKWVIYAIVGGGIAAVVLVLVLVVCIRMRARRNQR